MATLAIQAHGGTHIRSSGYDTNYSGESLIYSLSLPIYPMWAFDFSSLPSSAVIDSATFQTRMWSSSNSGTGYLVPIRRTGWEWNTCTWRSWKVVGGTRYIWSTPGAEHTTHDRWANANSVTLGDYYHWWAAGGTQYWNTRSLDPTGLQTMISDGLNGLKLQYRSGDGIFLNVWNVRPIITIEYSIASAQQIIVI